MVVVVVQVGEEVEGVVVHPSGEVEPTDCRKVAAGVGHEMVETQGVGVGHILVPDFAMVAVVQGQFAMEVVEHLTMVGVGVVVRVLQVPGEGMVQDHLVVEGVVGHHVDEGVDLGDPSLVHLVGVAALAWPMVVQKSCLVAVEVEALRQAWVLGCSLMA